MTILKETTPLFNAVLRSANFWSHFCSDFLLFVVGVAVLELDLLPQSKPGAGLELLVLPRRPSALLGGILGVLPDLQPAPAPPRVRRRAPVAPTVGPHGRVQAQAAAKGQYVMRLPDSAERAKF